MTDSSETPSTPLLDTNRSSRLFTIPNLLCAVRIAGSPGLVALGIAEEPYLFLAVYAVLAATDWLDGKLAVYLDQKSRIGPQLDSIADLMLYASLLIGGAWLVREPL